MKRLVLLHMVLIAVLVMGSMAACSITRRDVLERDPTVAPRAPTRAPLATQVPVATQAPVATQVPVATPTLGQAAPAATAPLSAAVNQLEAQVESVYASAGPSVVNITSQVITYGFRMQPIPQEGTGSGFVYDGAGHIVTNYHVVEDAQSISVALANGSVYDATVVGQDPSNDLAVLSIQAADLPPPLPLGDSSTLRVGQFVLAIGNPFALQRTLTLGIISALQRVIQSPDGSFIGQAIQTDAAINPGNSGGPLLDLQGRVVGVNSQIVGVTGASVGVGFAIPSNTLRQVVPQLIATGRYPHPWLGMDMLDISPQAAQILRQVGVDITVDQGVLVITVTSGSPAEAAGIHGADRNVRIGRSQLGVGGDIITAVDDQPVTAQEDLMLYVDTQKAIGDTIKLKLIRAGQEMTVSLTLGEQPQSQ